MRMDLLKRLKQNSQNKPIKEQTQLLFLKRLLNLLQHGSSLLIALDALTYEEKFVPIVNTLQATLKTGQPLDIAFEKARFNEDIITYLYFVRLSSDIEKSLLECIHVLERKLSYKEKLLKVIKYPLFLMFIFIIILIIIKQFIIPSFNMLFTERNNQFNVLNHIDMILNILFNGLLISSLILIIGFIIWLNHQKRQSVDSQIKAIERIPIYRKYKKYQLSLLFANQFSTFLSSGLSIKQILDHLSVQEKLPILAHYATIILEELNKGVKISMTLEQLPLLDEQLVDAFSKESESFIAHALNGYVIYITDKLYDDVMKWIQIIQPLFFTVIACFVIVIYLILLYPMLQFIESL